MKPWFTIRFTWNLGPSAAVALCALVLVIVLAGHRAFPFSQNGNDTALMLIIVDRTANKPRSVSDKIQESAPVEGQALAGTKTASSGVVVRGLNASDLKEIDLVFDTISEGTLDDFDAGGGVVIGLGLANKLGIHAGDFLTIVTPEGDMTSMGAVPRVRHYRVSAIFRTGISSYDSAAVFMTLSDARSFFSKKH